VLVVDDSADFREAMRLLLERSGFRVLTADNGADAIACASEQPLDAIIMDVSMPLLDGIDATAQLKASPRLASIPVIGYTAHPFDGVEVLAKAAGMREVLPKASFLDLLTVLRAIVKPTES
jgi:CheY-like chemotaxis protein